MTDHTAVIDPVEASPHQGRSAGREPSPLPLVTSLYVTQYLGVGFVYVGLTAMLRQQGVSLESLAAVSLAGVMWALKPLWAPLVDRYGHTSAGHYRTWLLVMQPLLALTGLALVTVREPERHLGLLGAVIAVYTFVSATQDIAADGLTARAVDDRTRPLANGVANAAQWLGNVLGGGVIVLVHAHLGWIPAMLTLTALSLMPLPMLLRHRERGADAPAPRLGQAYAQLGGVFRQPGGMRWGLVVMPLFLAGTTSAYGLLTPMLTDAGWSLTRLGWVMGFFLVAPAALASLAVGPCVHRYGARACLLVTGLVDALAIVALLPTATGHAPLVPTLVALAVYVAAMAASSTVVYSENMARARSASAATDFTTLAAVAMLASYLLGAALLAAAGSLGYPAVLGVCAVLALVGTAAAATRVRAGAGA
ncbi:MFS transporter [Mobilicoccus pelagius]|uniref:Putative major facilitator superfamily transporter n=1 Tax=Mobilicoccus pelagius NBRC 104925 TaxID=1089455 RepID=H5UT82_9MICO|nr:MFS transporter [Mobilicoccus pelagius]GAB48940.1 putative major facilitator superfamily transporter [Mobilicoccus pelagius NBRC 104925]